MKLQGITFVRSIMVPIHPFEQHHCIFKSKVKESKRLVNCFLNYLRHDKTGVGVLFEMLSVFLVRTRIDYTFLKEFYMIEILLKKKQQPLYEALQKLQEELMLLGFISLLLTVSQGPVNRICIPVSYARNMLPCKLPETKEESQETAEAPSSEHESPSRKLLSFAGFASRQLLSSGGGETSGYCEKKGKKPFVSTEGLHQLHIFIFVLAIGHVLFCVFTMLLGSAKMRMWKAWERDIQENK